MFDNVLAGRCFEQHIELIVDQLALLPHRSSRSALSQTNLPERSGLAEAMVRALPSLPGSSAGDFGALLTKAWVGAVAASLVCRTNLVMEMGVLSEHKIAKIVEPLGEPRWAIPQVRDRRSTRRPV